MAKDNGYHGIDLDKSLAYHESKWGVSKIGNFFPEMVKRIKSLMASGKQIKIFTARAAHGPEQVKMVQDALEKEGLPRFEVVNLKDRNLRCLFDDRAVRMIPNTGIPADLKILQEEAGVFSDVAFGTPQERGPLCPLAHLEKEILELKADLNDHSEWADCLLLLLDAARRAGVDADQLILAAFKKLEVNKTRKWGKPDENGVIQHIKE